MTSLYDFKAARPDGSIVPLSDHRGKVVLIVNTASQCGFTPQYEGLEALHRELQDRGLVVLGFPCNQFGRQEPGTDEEIASFCRLNYGVTFPVFAKVEVNGSDAAPLFRWLKEQAPGVIGTEGIKWNFTKFLVDRGGRVTGRFAPTTAPGNLRGAIEALL